MSQGHSGGPDLDTETSRLIFWYDRTLIKTQDYLEVFARFKQKENIEAVERMLAAHDQLERFERSQLGRLISPYSTSLGPGADGSDRQGSLCCGSAEEAKMLIPSLTNKISDADLQELCTEITKLRSLEFVE